MYQVIIQESKPETIPRARTETYPGPSWRTSWLFQMPSDSDIAGVTSFYLCKSGLFENCSMRGCFLELWIFLWVASCGCALAQTWRACESAEP